MKKYLTPLVIVLGIFIPVASFIGTAAVLFHRVGQLESQDTSELAARITGQWKVVSTIREQQNRFLGEWEFFKDKIKLNEQHIDRLRNRRPEGIR